MPGPWVETGSPAPINTSSGPSATDFANGIRSFSNLPFFDKLGFSSTINEFADRLDNLTAYQRANYNEVETGRSKYLDMIINRAEAGDEAALETLFNYYATRASEMDARKYNEMREDTAYQRLEADLRKAGISPYILSSASPAVMGTTSKTYSGTNMTSRASNVRSQETSRSNEIIGDVLRLFGIIASAIMIAAA